jgi:hypothetical protein
MARRNCATSLRAMIAWKKPTIPTTQPPATANTTTIANPISLMLDASAVQSAASNRFTNQSCSVAARRRAQRNPSLSVDPLSGILCESQPPGAGESGVASAAEGATGPRKRSGKRTAAGLGISGKPADVSHVCRTEEVRGAIAAP